MAGWIRVHTPEEIRVVGVSVQVMRVGYESRGAVTTWRHIKGPLGHTLSRAVAPVAGVSCPVVQEPLTEFEPVTCHTVHLSLFGILESDGPVTR
jgi:hypothetical protein